MNVCGKAVKKGWVRRIRIRTKFKTNLGSTHREVKFDRVNISLKIKQLEYNGVTLLKTGGGGK